MFTGIISDIGRVRSVTGNTDKRAVIATRYDTGAVVLGASIACAGVCLTVVDKGYDGDGHWFAVDVSAATLSCSTLAEWRTGKAVNLERALTVGDELGGHMVSGHVDGVGEVSEVIAAGPSRVLTLTLPHALQRFVAPKGSIAVDGVSLTVNEVKDAAFRVNIIPHTLSETTLGALVPGDRVNVEVDMLARYVARLNDVQDE